jgi:hypothetical protein
VIGDTNETPKSCSSDHVSLKREFSKKVSNLPSKTILKSKTNLTLTFIVFNTSQYKSMAVLGLYEKGWILMKTILQCKKPALNNSLLRGIP